MMKIYWIISLLILSLGFARGQGTDSTYSFFVAGHTYGTPGVDNEGLHPPFVDKFGYIQSRPEIAFGTFLGDIVFHSTEEAWDDVDNDIDSLGLPVYFAVGNHDMYDRPLFEERYGDTYYSFVFSNDLFIVLDPNIDHWNISGDQKLFLTNTIDNNADGVEKIFVFFNQLLWWQSDNKYSVLTPNSFEGRADTINFWSEIEPLFSELDNEVVMFADDIGAASGADNVMYDTYDNITFIATGMGNGVGDNFIVSNEQNGHDISYDLICLTGEFDCLGTLESNDVDNLYAKGDQKEGIKIYPNPLGNRNMLNVEFTCQMFTPISCIIYSQTGTIVYKYKLKSPHNRIDLSELSPGYYIIKIIHENRSSINKLIKF
ncbi:MAG: T9SS type A sorting domain-containing protein [Candidatus Delongbacteria bacterium]|jgi:hypothetical protein|nr:T9SS type A sorting domain-containing protein [Candidatus Delongbacteria bacterium]